MRNYKHIHFTGIGGVGMSGMAKILLDAGFSISGSDVTDSASIERLRKSGASIHIKHSPANIPKKTDLLVYSSAINNSNPEWIEAEKRDITKIRRGCFLPEIASLFDYVICVAGSHGKTTTTAILTHILRSSHKEPGFMIGGEVESWETPASYGAGKVFITEVDESDGTQAYMKSDLAIITNVEDDHCWNLGGEDKLYECFKNFANSAKKIITYRTPKTSELFSDHNNIQFIDKVDVLENLQIPQPGEHNRQNAFIAQLAAENLAIKFADSADAVTHFPGVKRRLSIKAHNVEKDLYLIEDYAHHPTEVRATISALQEKYPNLTLIIIFQPHRFERIARYKKEFAKELSLAHYTYVTSAFAAWVDNHDFADPAEIVSAMPNGKAELLDYSKNKDLIAKYIFKSFPKKNAVLAIFGAGTITELIPYLSKNI